MSPQPASNAIPKPHHKTKPNLSAPKKSAAVATKTHTRTNSAATALLATTLPISTSLIARHLITAKPRIRSSENIKKLNVKSATIRRLSGKAFLSQPATRATKIHTLASSNQKLAPHVTPNKAGMSKTVRFAATTHGYRWPTATPMSNVNAVTTKATTSRQAKANSA